VSYVRIEGLTKQFRAKPPTIANDDLDLEIEQGEFLVLLGPSGCGKTTTLRCLAGLETPDTGRISFGDRTVFDAAAHTNLSPDKRNIGMVFQSYALWPHMTVRKNIGYPLRTRRVPKEQAKQWIEETADLVDCGNLLDRFPGQLSGGQQQRVALARGLVARPDLVLFDEPLSNLDARLRDQVRAQLHELHGRLHFTAVFVTHDQVEALALGERMAIMRAGKIEQFDTPEHVFERPATEYVAAFIGMANRLELERQDDGWRCFGEPVAGDLPELSDTRAAVFARLRPEDLVLSPGEEARLPETASIPARIVDSEFGGRHMDVVVAVGAARLQARVPSGQLGGWARTLKLDQPVTMSFRPSDAMYYDDAGVRVAGTVRVETADPVVT
jgi:iron(III) transport system ATP-binding protein